MSDGRLSTYRTIMSMIESGTEDEKTAAEGIIKALIGDRAQAVRELECAHGVICEMQKMIDSLNDKIRIMENNRND